MALQIQKSINGVATLVSDNLKVNLGEQNISDDFYAKVQTVIGGKDNLSITVNFKTDNMSFNKSYDFTPSVADGSSNFIKQAYQHLKTLSEFSLALDC